MMQLTASAVSIGAFIFLLAPAARAAAIFTNFGAGESYNTSAGNTVGNDFAGDNLAEGDTFTPAVTAVFGSLQIALSCGPGGCPDSYTVVLARDSGDSPGTALETFSASGLSLGALGGNNAPQTLTAVGSPITLTAGTRYWVTVRTDLFNSIDWNLTSTADPSDQAISSDGGATWFSPSGLTPGAYEVDAGAGTATPEPGAAGLATLGLAGLGLLSLGRPNFRPRPIGLSVRLPYIRMQILPKCAPDSMYS